VTPPRVLFSFPGRIGTTGIGTTAWHQATGLARRGAEVLVACGSVERALPGVHVVAETMRAAGRNIPYRAVGVDRAIAVHDWRVARLLLAGGHDVDVVHAWPGGGVRTLRAARARGIPGFLERPNAHTAFGFEVVARECERLGMRLGASSPHAFDAVKLEREEREFAAAQALLCPSDFVAATHAARGEHGRRLLRHRYGYDPARFSPPGGDTSRRALAVTFLGRLEPRKGVHVALEAWRRADLGHGAGRFVLCGRMEPGYEAVLAPLLAQPGVELRPHVADPAELLRDSDVLVLPSLEEGSALVTYEAQVAGCVPLVSTAAGALLDHDVHGLVHRPGDVATLTAQLDLLDADRATLGRLGAAAMAHAPELSWAAASRSLVAAYGHGRTSVAPTGQDLHADAA
jgi:glycosyltransferase involved in cell wall biosynthesis